MIKINHPDSNHIFNPPQGWDQNQLPCDSLHVVVGDYCGQPSITSHWQPSDEELEMLNRGGVIALSIIGLGMPPVAINIVEIPAVPLELQN